MSDAQEKLTLQSTAEGEGPASLADTGEGMAAGAPLHVNQPTAAVKYVKKAPAARRAEAVVPSGVTVAVRRLRRSGAMATGRPRLSWAKANAKLAGVASRVLGMARRPRADAPLPGSSGTGAQPQDRDARQHAKWELQKQKRLEKAESAAKARAAAERARLAALEAANNNWKRKVAQAQSEKLQRLKDIDEKRKKQVQKTLEAEQRRRQCAQQRRDQPKNKFEEREAMERDETKTNANAKTVRVYQENQMKKLEKARTESKCPVPPAVQPAVPPAVQPAVPPGVQLAVPPAVQPAEQPAVQPAVQPNVHLPVPPAVLPAMQSAVLPAVPPAVQTNVQLAVPPVMQLVYMEDGFEYLYSDEDEAAAAPEMPVPVWCETRNFFRAAEIQYKMKECHLNRLFSVRAQTADLREIFPNVERGKLVRTSSAKWRSPPPPPPPPAQ